MKKIGLLFTCLFFVSCDDTLADFLGKTLQERYEEDHLYYDENNGGGNYTSPYKGSWKGFYTGNDKGSIELEVRKDSGCNIVLASAFGGRQEFFTQVYDNGTFKNENGIYMFGSLDKKKKTGSGTWKMGAMVGTWEVTKE